VESFKSSTTLSSLVMGFAGRPWGSTYCSLDRTVDLLVRDRAVATRQGHAEGFCVVRRPRSSRSRILSIAEVER